MHPARATRPAVASLVATACLSLALAPVASSQPVAGRGPELGVHAAEPRHTSGLPGHAPAEAGLDMPASYPHQPLLRVDDHDPADRSYAGALTGYADIAPRLNDLMARSDRVSAQVVGRSTDGRDLYLVTVTAPESADETRRQTAYRELIRHDPARAARHRRLHEEYKAPIWVSANIHGNEWEGTDASLRYIEELAVAPWSEVSELLDGHRLYFSLSLNPDGRYLGTRATALGFDANRDMITNVTPESRSYVRTAQELLALHATDLHGYTGVLQVEPAGPPHGENYEYDLLLPHSYALALQVERDVVEAAVPGNPLLEGGIRIPYRDTPSGWDDYPPIFTAQYAAFYGAITSTVELPLGRAAGDVQTPERAAVNTAVAGEVIRSTVDYVAAHSEDLLANQIEFFRRGAAGEPKVVLTGDGVADVPGPEQWRELWDVTDDQDPVDLPRAYVIPVGEGQRSLSDTTDLVEHLLLHDVEVRALERDTTLAGTTYPRGSYVVDLHQPKRGLANALLDRGSDISGTVPSMYDVSAWSLGHLWGATVDRVGSTTDGPVLGTRVVREPARQASVPKMPAYVTFDVAGVRDHRALHEMLAEDAVAWLLPSGRAVVAPESHDLAVNAAVEHDIAVLPATRDEIATVTSGGAKELEEVRVGYVGGQDQRTVLAELGLAAEPVSAAAVAADPGVLSDLDVLVVGAGFSPGSAGRAAVQDWLAEGNALVGTGRAGFAAAQSFGLVSATAVAGNGEGNGIVAVDTPQDSILASHAQEHAFVYPAVSFTDLGEGTRAEQTYAGGNPLVAGHWRATGATNGPEHAAGRASVISGEVTDGGRAVVFGTSVTFRAHPRGGMSQVGQAILWAAD